MGWDDHLLPEKSSLLYRTFTNVELTSGNRAAGGGEVSTP